jgi:hypothetical protein
VRTPPWRRQPGALVPSGRDHLAARGQDQSRRQVPCFGAESHAADLSDGQPGTALAGTVGQGPEGRSSHQKGELTLPDRYRASFTALTRRPPKAGATVPVTAVLVQPAVSSACNNAHPPKPR